MLTLLLPKLMERLRLPGPVGYILAGIILGPNVFAILNPDGKVVNFFADLGKLLLMFFAGFEVDVDQFNRARRKAATFGLFTFACPFVLAAALGASLGYPPVACAVIGAVLASHTLLGLPIVKKYDLMGNEPVVATVGATVFTDMLAILVLAICLPIHVGGVDPAAVGIQLAWLAVYVPGVLFGLSAVAKWLLRVLGTTQGGARRSSCWYLRWRHGSRNGFDATDETTGVVLAAHAAAAILASRRGEQLESALSTRTASGRPRASSWSVSASMHLQAFEMLRELSPERQHAAIDVAQRVIDTRGDK